MSHQSGSCDNPSNDGTTPVTSILQQDETTPWTDDRIRWDDDDDDTTKKENDTDDNHLYPTFPLIRNQVEEDESALEDPFKNVDSTETFVREFTLKSNYTNTHDTSLTEPPSSTSSTTIRLKLQGYKYEADEIWTSTGLTLWRAADFLCDYIVNHHTDLFVHSGHNELRILELGAGLGLVGILVHNILVQIGLTTREVTSSECDPHRTDLTTTTANSTPCSFVCVTDGDTNTLEQLRHNIECNCDLSTSTALVHKIICRQLLWGRNTAGSFLQHNDPTRSFDVILSSDIIYAACIVEPLWQTIQTVLSDSGVFIMAFAKRRVPVTIEEVLIEADKAGFRHQLVAEDPSGIWIYTFHWKNYRK